MKSPLSGLPDGIRRLVERCAWCRAPLLPDMRVVIVGGRFATWSPEIEEIRGQVVEVQTRRVPHVLPAVVPLAGTSAHASGYDVLLVVCGGACREALDDALRGEAVRLAGRRRDRPGARRRIN